MTIRQSRTVRVTRGVWLPAAVAAEPVARLAALLAALPPGTVLSGVTAAWLHGLWVAPASRVEVTVPAGPRGSRLTTVPQRRELVAHRAVLAADEVVEVGGIPATSVPRTWADLSAVLGLPDLVAAGDSALRCGIGAADLADAVVRRGRRAGAARARAAVALVDRRSRSRPESHLRVALVGAGLPAPEVNVSVHDERGGWLAEPDLSYPAARLAVEYQGAEHADPGRMRRDTARHMDLRRAGWDVLYYTAAQVFTHPEVPVADVRGALAARAPQLFAGVRGSPRR